MRADIHRPAGVLTPALYFLRPLELFQYIVSDVGDSGEQFHGLCGVDR